MDYEEFERIVEWDTPVLVLKEIKKIKKKKKKPK